jgi:hypothetical protein
VPGGRAPGVVEDLGLLDPVLAQSVDEQVVGLDEAELHLVHEEVGVVALIADQGDALVISRNVVAALTEQELRRVVLLEEVRRTRRAGCVDAFEVGARRPEVLDAIRVCVMAERSGRR